ncbi:hypothetical protein B0H13DRAFT_2024156 [Mycena leptocephala]|nr:hypothetical protein B0H13DRAFT_2024156 [Mycena leptocephala]
MTQTSSPARPDLKELVERLGGHLDACLIDENSQTLAHGPVTIASNCVSGVYKSLSRLLAIHIIMSAQQHAKFPQRFYVCWSARLPITALCAIVLSQLPDGTNNRLRVHDVSAMDRIMPHTQVQTSGWFLGPPAGTRGFIQLEFCKAARDARHPRGYTLDPRELASPPIIIRFELIGLPVVRNVKRELDAELERESLCMRPVKQDDTMGNTGRSSGEDIPVVGLLMAVILMELTDRRNVACKSHNCTVDPTSRNLMPY